MTYRSNTGAIGALALLCFLSGQATAQTPTSALALSSSKNPSVFGEQVTFLVADSEDLPGTVQFVDGSVNLGSAILVSQACPFSPCEHIPPSIGFLSTSALAPGVHSITATFDADGTIAPSSATVTQTVIAAAPIASAPSLSSWAATMMAILVGVIGMVYIFRSRS
jgi:large repetitive protein